MKNLVLVSDGKCVPLCGSHIVSIVYSTFSLNMGSATSSKKHYVKTTYHRLTDIKKS